MSDTELHDRLRAILADPDAFAEWLAGDDGLAGEAGVTTSCPLANYVRERLGPDYAVEVTDEIIAWRSGNGSVRAHTHAPVWVDRFVNNVDITPSGRRRMGRRNGVVSRRTARRALKEALEWAAPALAD